MATGNGVQLERCCCLGCATIIIASIWSITNIELALGGPIGTDPSNPTIRETADLAVLLWPLGATLPFSPWNLSPDRARDNTTRNRWAHTIACALRLRHVAIAFHLGHAWSHHAAFDQTEQVSGFGPGIYVIYLFVLVWIADVIWAWVALDQDLNRPTWVSWLISPGRFVPWPSSNAVGLAPLLPCTLDSSTR